MQRTLLLLAVVAIASATIAFAASCSPAKTGYPIGQSNVTVQRPESTREFLVYVPASYSGSQPAAVLFTFHGLGDTCTNFIQATSFMPFADQYGFILVAPCGSAGILGNAWNSGTCCGFLDPDHPNDFAFVQNIVSLLETNLCIDTNRIVTSGFSNGAFMSEVLGCEESTTFRGVASVSGVVELRPGNSEGIAVCTDNITAAGKTRPRVLMIHGDADLIVPWTGDALLGFPPVPDNVQGWVSRNGCTGNGTQTLNVTHYTNQVWDSCTGWQGAAGDGKVEIVRNHGGGHEWPMTDHFNTTDYIFNFFKDLLS